MATKALPKLFLRPGWYLDLLNNRPQAAEALDLRGTFDEFERAHAIVDELLPKLRAILADGDLSREGRDKRIAALLGDSRNAVREILDGAVDAIEQDRKRSLAELDEASRPPAPESIALVAHELRVQGTLRSLEGMSPGDRVAAVLAAAQRGDLIPTIAAERSYHPTPLVPSGALGHARMLYAEASNQPAAKTAGLLGEQKELAERVASELGAKLEQAISRVVGVEPKAAAPTVEEQIAAALAAREA